MDRAALETLLNAPVVRTAPLSGGCVAAVRCVDLADGRRVVVKAGRVGDALDLEGWMLDTLATRSALPVPRVLHAADDLLVMEWIDAPGRLGVSGQEHAADLLAALHGVTAPCAGCDRDTVIGGLPQPNPWTPSWREFFRDQRLLHMARRALDAGRLPAALMSRIETLAARLETWIDDDVTPSLLHGDLWTGNVLVGADGRIAAFIDPAIYYGDAEIELAFSTLFGTFSEPFFARYGDHRPIRPGFFEARRDLYNLYPLLVHVRLFGGGYVGSVERTLSRFGC